MINLVAPGKQLKYPHIFGEDKILLSKFWEQNTINFKSIAYDVPIRGYFDYDILNSKNINNNWDYLASYKIDMLGFTDKFTYICELKHQSKPEAIGQLLVYNHLFKKHSSNYKSIRLLLITFQLKPIIQEVCNKYGIETLIIKNDKYDFTK